MVGSRGTWSNLWIYKPKQSFLAKTFPQIIDFLQIIYYIKQCHRERVGRIWNQRLIPFQSPPPLD